MAKQSENMLKLRFSPYSLSKLLVASCPHAFKLKYIDGIKERASDAANFGRHIHECIAAHLRGKELPEVPANLINRAEEIAGIMETVKERFKVTKAIAGIEEQIAIDINGKEIDYWNKDAYFRGVIDVVEIYKEKAKVTDHKSSWHHPSQQEVDRDKQIGNYGYLTWCHFPFVKEVEIGIHTARFGLVRSTTKTVDELQSYRKALDKRITEVENLKSFDANPCGYCDFCGFVLQCPFLKELEKKGEVLVRDDKEAVQAAQELRALEVRTEAIKKKLKTYCGEHGPVQISDYAYGYKEMSKNEYPVEQTVDILSESGVDANLVLSVSGTKIKKFLKKDELGDSLRAIAIDKSSTVFKGYKTKEE